MPVDSTDFALTLERPSGRRLEPTNERQVPASAGDQYVIVIRSNVSRRALVHISVDGLDVSGPGFVLRPWGTLKLEGPYQTPGRFTVRPEGDTEAFGSDGGRGNPMLGLVEARIQVEAPTHTPDALMPLPLRPYPWWPHYPHPAYPPCWHGPLYSSPTSVFLNTNGSIVGANNCRNASLAQVTDTGPSPSLASGAVVAETSFQAAGTGLTGEERQHFSTTSIGNLEPQETILRLRLVIGPSIPTPAVRPLPGRIAQAIPPRPQTVTTSVSP